MTTHPCHAPAAQPTRPERLQRSELAVPATNPRFFAKAAASSADVIFLDLEDAVAPAAKDEARARAVAALNDIDWGHRTMAVRVNGLDTPWAHRDILDVARLAPRLDLILLPKAGSAFDVQFVDQLLTLIERETGRTKRTGIEVLIETALGVANAEAIAQSSARLEAMIFGVGDYTVDMRTYDDVFGAPSERYAVLTGASDAAPRQRHWNDQWHFAMARIANACRAHGLRPIDGPYTDFRDAEGYRASASRAAALGFEGKWAIHPSQIELANEAFSPTQAQLDWAARITRLIEDTNRSGQGAVGDGGVLVDMAHLKQAEHLRRRRALIERFASAAG
ncbi:HpcH/HpaI aldolase/citrate lyase family protein [Bordetella genomosp. 11]|uniref:CoA ester lyase n=1 Tax=Bordetella genomosp. 11 TaxID=1416808 RepID=A0A261UN01_9BORD|nr:CoA ester lyase [Bordetella genomosp. 11]OZI63011.1 CoA ester lyase [Bordetella genomosp. 11]